MKRRAPPLTFHAVLLLAAVGCLGDPTSGLQPDLSGRTAGAPEGWFGGTPAPRSWGFGLDTHAKRGGARAAYLMSFEGEPEQFVAIGHSIRAALYRGQRVRWSAWVKPTGVAGTGGGLWMRIDGPGRAEAFDNMSDRAILGSGDWTWVAVVLDVPPSAIGIAMGALLSGPGDLLIDDAQFEIVGDSVPSTNQLDEPQPTMQDSAAYEIAYATARSLPVNLDLEGVRPPPAETFTWLAEHSMPLATAEPGSNRGDLAPLGAIIGTARVVGMGEATHGTHEFFRMKHRVFEFLVHELGFRHFAIEATWAEANDLNLWVQGGAGDSAQLLSRLYFWTWRTQEVLELISWMRTFNEGRAPGDRVQFSGFDMQFPGAPLDTVLSFITRVDSAESAFVAGRIACLTPFRDSSGVFRRPASQYAALSSSERTACRAGLSEVHDMLISRQAAYQAVSDSETFAHALRSARLLQQWEEMAGLAETSGGFFARDRFMAENIQWLLDQAGPGARMMLWAHNAHVSKTALFMGDYLEGALGGNYLSLAFSFGRGTFNAVGASGIRSHTADPVPSVSLEAAFDRAGRPIQLFDARTILAGGVDAAPLAGPISMRQIGAFYNASAPQQYFVPVMLPGDFDLLIYFDNATASTLLPATTAAAAPPFLP